MTPTADRLTWRRTCPYCGTTPRFVPLADHIDACPQRRFPDAGYSSPVAQQFSDLLRAQNAAQAKREAQHG